MFKQIPHVKKARINLASLVTKDAILKAIEKIDNEELILIPATKFHVIYKKKSYPPKELVRVAARIMGIKNLSEYNLNGGNPTNEKLEALGFKIEQFADWETKNKSYVSRITWNTNGWIKPSGNKGKSKDVDSFENANGFGHEEWLFDTSREIEGYLYGFIETIRKPYKQFIGKSIDLQLYTIDGVSKDRFHIADIKNCIIISEAEAVKIKTIFKKKGWLKEMNIDLENINAKEKRKFETQTDLLFNVKFKKEDISYYGYKLIEKPNEIYKLPRYTLTDKYSIESTIISKGFKFIGGNNKKIVTKSNTIKSSVEETEVELLHEEISIALTNVLEKMYGSKNVKREHPHLNNRIDIVLQQGKSLTFYEIKTYNSIKKCIREALGQLIEYSMYHNCNIAKELIIVTSPFNNTKEEEMYMEHIRNLTGLNIYLQYFNLKTNKLSNKK